MSVATIILGIMCALWLVLIWLVICNHFTFKHRMKLIDVIYSKSGEYHKDSACLDKVSYDKHLWTMATFRNPLKLYPQHIIGELTNA